MRIRPSSPNRRTDAASDPAWPEGQLAAQGVKVSHNAAWLFLRPEGQGFKKSLFALERGRIDISRLHRFAPYGHWRTLTFSGLCFITGASRLALSTDPSSDCDFAHGLSGSSRPSSGKATWIISAAEVCGGEARG
jgi:hypothetical protein